MYSLELSLFYAIGNSFTVDIYTWHILRNLSSHHRNSLESRYNSIQKNTISVHILKSGRFFRFGLKPQHLTILHSETAHTNNILINLYLT